MSAGSAEDVRRTLGLDKPRGPRIFLRILLGLALAVAVALGGFILLQRRAASHVPRYKSELVGRGDLRITIAATGKVQSLNTVEVGAEVTGKVLRVLVDYNDLVKKGQLLAEIDPEQLRAAADEVRAQVRAAESGIKTAEATLLETKQARERALQQAKEGLISQGTVESAQASAARAEASRASSLASAELARATLKSAESKLGKTKIFSPIDGIVLARLVEPGQTVTAGFQTPLLFRLAEDLTKLALHCDIDEADIGHVRQGMEASFTVDAYPGRTFPSRVESLRNDPKTSQSVVTYEAILSVDNSGRELRPGMTATATIVSNTLLNVVTVPNAALRFTPPVKGAPSGATASPPRASEQRVYQLRGQVLTPIPVKVGASDGHLSELLAPSLGVGTEVVVDVIEQP